MFKSRDSSGLLSRAAQLKRWTVATTSIWYAILVGAGMLLAGRSDYAEQRRERNFDWMLTWLEPQQSAEIVVVDIDMRTLAAKGPWPWGRDRIASLMEAIASAKPRAIGVDTLIAGPDQHSPAALARRLADATGKDDIAQLAGTLADADQRLAVALAGAPTTLGVALSPVPTGDRAPPTPLLVSGRVPVDDFWQAEGVIAPVQPLADAAAGLGMLLLPGDSDGKVRRVPLLAVVGDRLWPSLAVEVVRSYGGASALLLAADAGRLDIAGRAVPIGADGMLRLIPLRHDLWADRTLSALDVLDLPEARQRLAGRLVLIGGSAPELGGLRAAASSPLVPSVMLHAAAAEQILTGRAPIRNRATEVAEVAAAAAACLLATWLAHGMSPLIGSVVTAGLAILWVAGASLLLWQQRLVDPFLVPAIIVTCFTVAGFLSAAASKRREAALRRRFEQHLAPEVVARLVAQPELLRLEGEMREITALFTDIEGFTAMTERVDPRTLVGLLDRYFDGLTQIVIEHRGMVEKIVGDGLHAIFNAPLDLADHPQRAVDCAIAIRDFGERFRGDTEAAAAGFGRTRIGLETGVAVVGDVGGGRKLDYTAHGDAMNMASRLESANKELGSSICIGPVTAARLPNRSLRPLGRIEVRGRSAPSEVFDPWPDALDKSQRKTYLKAVTLADKDPLAAAENLDRLAMLTPHDPVPTRLAARLRAQMAGSPESSRSGRSPPARTHGGSKKRRR
jgi:adenylate cyclase